MNLGNIAGVMQMVYQTTNQTQRQAVNGSSFTDKLQEAKGVVDVNNAQETAGTESIPMHRY